MTRTEGRRKRAVITGGNGGMGRALARAFGETMDLVLTDIAGPPMGRAERERNPRAAMFIDCIPAGRLATAMDIVATARFLASDGASFISGRDIRVDGAAVPALQAMLARK